MSIELVASPQFNLRGKRGLILGIATRAASGIDQLDTLLERFPINRKRSS